MDIHAHWTKRLAAALAAAAAVAALAACGSPTGQGGQTDPDKKSGQVPVPNGPIVVVASVNQWGSLAEEIGGEDVQVTSVLSSTGVDAHGFEPKAADRAALSRADVVVANGAGYDAWATKSLRQDVLLVSAADMVGAMEGDNPHLWFSKDARAAMAKELADAFAKERPGKAKDFQRRLEAWQGRENRLDELTDGFAKADKGASYAATEAVAHYLMADLGFEDVTPTGYAQAVASEGEPAPADLKDFQEVLKRHEASLLIDNPQEASDAAGMIVDAAGQAQVPVMDVSEQMPGDHATLVGWINALVNQIIDKVDPSYGCDQADESDGTDGAGESDPSGEAGGSDHAESADGADGKDQEAIGRVCPADGADAQGQPDQRSDQDE
ncbi:metal ABC transporter solute-binding protein, Zn/Mn family [Bifidobacterium pullorum]|uniref:metal ABC transporter solute-binding protein, Zn/Mn family n=1 Tax=Bifidobacterium pullorum TaxID=78448 RepID=UPI0023AA4339|nr:zinc ABC transporter substrate-binding protein [Bifidobacterium pullorum]